MGHSLKAELPVLLARYGLLRRLGGFKSLCLIHQSGLLKLGMMLTTWRTLSHMILADDPLVLESVEVPLRYREAQTLGYKVEGSSETLFRMKVEPLAMRDGQLLYSLAPVAVQNLCAQDEAGLVFSKRCYIF